MSEDVKQEEPRAGDKVRLTYHYEGTVKIDRVFGPAIQTVHGDTVYLDLIDRPDVKFEILERSLPKVGDVVSAEDLNRLPVYSVVKAQVDGPHGPIFERDTGDSWLSPTCTGLSGRDDYLIVYIP